LKSFGSYHEEGNNQARFSKRSCAVDVRSNAGASSHLFSTALRLNTEQHGDVPDLWPVVRWTEEFRLQDEFKLGS